MGLMKNQHYRVVPERANPLGYFLLHTEKGIRWYITKVFQDGRRAAYHYQFALLGPQGKPVSEAAYPAFARSKGLTPALGAQAAAWFLTRYFSFRELHYSFTSVSSPCQGGYYPVLGRYDCASGKVSLQKQDFELSWD